MNDFIVIGGGIAGISAGARLSDLGSVTVVEAEDALGYHATGRSAAMFEENYGNPTTCTLNRASRAWHEALGVLSPRGFLCVGTGQTAAEFEGDVRSMNMEVVTAAEAQSMVPILDLRTVDRAAYEPDAADIDTDRLLQSFASQIRRAGGQIRTGAPVTAISRTRHGWQVIAGGVPQDARILINAAGPWADAIATLAGIAPLGLRPLRRSMARIAAPAGHDVSGWPMILGAGESWYAKPDAGALLVSPAEEDPCPPMAAWADDLVLAEGLARYEAHVTEPVTRPLATWAGLRTFAPDRALAIGPDPADPAFLWSAGLGGYGIQSSPAVSALVASYVAGTPPGIGQGTVKALSPSRFDRR